MKHKITNRDASTTVHSQAWVDDQADYLEHELERMEAFGIELNATGDQLLQICIDRNMTAKSLIEMLMDAMLRSG